MTTQIREETVVHRNHEVRSNKALTPKRCEDTLNLLVKTTLVYLEEEVLIKHSVGESAPMAISWT